MLPAGPLVGDVSSCRLSWIKNPFAFFEDLLDGKDLNFGIFAGANFGETR